MLSKLKKARWMIAAAVIAGSMGYAAEPAHAVIGEGENMEYWGTGGGGYCGGRCTGHGPCC